jgi:hypothetical protein
LQKSKKEPAPGVYGYLATSEMWEIFKKDWKAMLDQYCGLFALLAFAAYCAWMAIKLRLLLPFTPIIRI